MRKKTKQMLAVEERLGEPLQTILPGLITERGLVGSADHIGVSKATLGYWLLKLDITVHRVALAPGYSLMLVNNRTGNEQEIASNSS